METAEFLTIIQNVLLLVLQLMAPVLIVAIVVGLLISIFQSVTQIQEATLTFVPKIIACVLTLIIMMPWMVNLFISRTNELFELMVTLAK